MRMRMRRHGARFLPDTGLCVHGPCAGQSLNALPVEVGSAGEVTVAVKDLDHLCDHGGQRPRAVQTFAAKQRARRQQQRQPGASPSQD